MDMPVDPKHQRNANGMFSIEQGHEILMAIFPNYVHPEYSTSPCHRCPDWAMPPKK
jgi:hypothetical protein